ncbi:hypothetical protein [Collinsella sp. An2]|uniref:hypothetical protein n=1 Tax=Collinsella sp. An2 TaxID=1965585 RepID=UPI00117FC316|nr:hypothetical protein [Collinsella sp. An2]
MVITLIDTGASLKEGGAPVCVPGTREGSGACRVKIVPALPAARGMLRCAHAQQTRFGFMQFVLKMASTLYYTKALNWVFDAVLSAKTGVYLACCEVTA